MRRILRRSWRKEEPLMRVLELLLHHPQAFMEKRINTNLDLTSATIRISSSPSSLLFNQHLSKTTKKGCKIFLFCALN